MLDRVAKWLSILTQGPAESRSVKDSELANEVITYLAGQISVPQKAQPVLDTVEKLRVSATDIDAKLPAIYLLLERYLVEVDPHERFTRKTLRDSIQSELPSLRSREAFRLIFSSPDRQRVLLPRTFLVNVLDETMVLLGNSDTHSLVSVRRWLESVPRSPEKPVPFQLTDQLPESDSDWTDLLLRLSSQLYHLLEETLGEAADRIYQRVYEELEYSFRALDTFYIVVELLPEKLLDEHKIQVLNRSRELSNKEERLNSIEQQLLRRDKELRETKEELQAVLQTVGEGILTVDSDGIIVLCNREVRSTWGYTDDELIGRHITRLLTADDTAGGRTRRSRFMSRTIPRILGRRVEMTGRTKYGREFPVELHANETRMGDRRLFTIAVHDITEQKRAQEELLEAKEKAEEMSRLKSAFLANMSHEIRTPLTSILGFAELLGDQDVEDPSRFTALIRQSGQRLLKTLNSVLDMAQLEAGSKALNVEPVRVSDEIEELIRIFQSKADEKGLSLDLSLPQAPVTAHLDSACLNRIINNLLSNAIKFTHDGGVRVTLREHNERIVITVEDSGIGMGEKFKTQVFEAFRQESTGLNREYEGSGLGLTITHRLVQLMNGSIDVESTKGEGTTFTVSLPSTLEDEVAVPADERVDPRSEQVQS